MTVPDEHPATGPVTVSERIVAVDIVRGFALWGVLLVNMWNFAAFPYLKPIDRYAEWAMRFFFQDKSWTLFSFLFGLGFALQMTRAGGRGARFLPRYTCRLVVLFGFSFIAYVTSPEFGILTIYAVLGFVLLLCRSWSPRWLLVAAALFLLVAPAYVAIRSMVPSDPEAAVAAARAASDAGQARFDVNQERVRVRNTGSIFANWGFAARRFPQFVVDYMAPFDANGSGWLHYFSMFLLGLYAGKRRIFHDFEQHRVLVRRVFFLGLPLGLLAMIVAWIFNNIVSGPLSPAIQFARLASYAYGAPALALSYAAGLVLLVQQPRGKRILAPLGSMGRMTLTVYLSQGIVFPALFFGFGLGQMYRVGGISIIGYAALMYTVELAICVWWMKWYRFGPAEWLWRTLTYFKLQPMRLPWTESAGAKAAVEARGP